MGFYSFSEVLISSIFLILFIFTAHTNALTLSVSSEDKSNCTGTSSSNQTCNVAPYAGHVALTCNADLLENQKLEWYKGNSSTALPRNDDRVKISGSERLVLNFTYFVAGDHSNYSCRASSKDKEDSSAGLIGIRVLPFVKNPSKEVTVIEEHSLNLTCHVLSAINATVTWNISTPEVNATYSESTERIILYDVNQTKNAILHIKSANISKDRGSYVCSAYSDVGESLTSTTFSVRVRSKYAAVWPFLGICAEVIILCTIILIYEKKRDKSEMEESDTDQGPETKSSPDHGQDNVRYRK